MSLYVFCFNANQENRSLFVFVFDVVLFEEMTQAFDVMTPSSSLYSLTFQTSAWQSLLSARLVVEIAFSLLYLWPKFPRAHGSHDLRALVKISGCVR